LRRVARAGRLHISDYRLPAIIDVDVLDADILVSAVAEAAKGLDLHGIGPHQSSRDRFPEPFFRPGKSEPAAGGKPARARYGGSIT
jgi:hypothetical protein